MMAVSKTAEGKTDDDKSAAGNTLEAENMLGAENKMAEDRRVDYK